MTTVRDLIRNSLQDINVVGAGENLTAEDAVDCLSRLNTMLASWSADGSVIYNRTTDTLNLSGGVQSYTIGPSGDINTTRPIAITQATITIGGNIVNPVEIWNENVFSTLSYPSLQGGTPYQLFVNNSFPLIQMKFFPVPSGGQVLTLYTMKPLGGLVLNDVLSLPPGYEEAIQTNLSVRVASMYERQASKDIKDTAHMSLATIKANNRQYFEATQAVDYALDIRWTNDGNTWGYNIYGGY